MALLSLEKSPQLDRDRGVVSPGLDNADDGRLSVALRAQVVYAGVGAIPGDTPPRSPARLRVLQQQIARVESAPPDIDHPPADPTLVRVS